MTECKHNWQVRHQTDESVPFLLRKVTIECPICGDLDYRRIGQLLIFVPQSFLDAGIGA